MATRAELLEKAKAAKAAKDAGTVGEFVADSRQRKKASTPKDESGEAPAASPSPVTAAKPGDFGGLVNLRRSSSMDDEDGGNDYVDAIPEDQRDRLSAKPSAQATGSTLITPEPVAMTADAPASPNPQPRPTPAPVLNTARAAFSGLVASARNRRSADEPDSYPTSRNEQVQAAKAPSTPDAEWAERTIPAGSKYSLAEWEAARAGGGFHVFEVRSGSEGSLVKAPKVPNVSASNQKFIVNGKMGTEAAVGITIDPNSAEYMSPMIGLLVDGCLLLGPKAPTTHPAAATSLYTIKMPDGKDWLYRVVRPASHRDDPQTAWLFTAKGGLPFIAPVPQDAPHKLFGDAGDPHRNGNDVVPDEDEATHQDANVARERMAG